MINFYKVESYFEHSWHLYRLFLWWKAGTCIFNWSARPNVFSKINN